MGPPLSNANGNFGAQITSPHLGRVPQPALKFITIIKLLGSPVIAWRFGNNRGVQFSIHGAHYQQLLSTSTPDRQSYLSPNFQAKDREESDSVNKRQAAYRMPQCQQTDT